MEYINNSWETCRIDNTDFSNLIVQPNLLQQENNVFNSNANNITHDNEDCLIPLNKECVLPDNEELVIPDYQECVIPHNEELVLLTNREHYLPDKLIRKNEGCVIPEEERIIPDNLISNYEGCVIPVITHSEEHVIPKNERRITPEEESVILYNKEHVILYNKEHVILDNKESAILDNKQSVILDNKERVILYNQERRIPKNEGGEIINNKGSVMQESEEYFLPQNEGHILNNNEGCVIPDDERVLVHNEEHLIPKNERCIIPEEERVIFENKEHVILEHKECVTPKNEGDVIINNKGRVMQESEEDFVPPNEGRVIRTFQVNSCNDLFQKQEGQQIVQQERGINLDIRNAIAHPLMTFSSIRKRVYENYEPTGQFLKQNRNLFSYGREIQLKWKNDALPRRNESDYLRIATLTWNLHGGCPIQQLDTLLTVLKKSPHHIMAIATQECERSIAASFFISSKSKWEQAILDRMKGDYVIVSSIKMNAMHLIVLSHRTLFPFISRIETDSKATGIGNYIGNKGGIAISFFIGGNSFLFVNVHLSSGKEKQERRNRDFIYLEKNLDVGRRTSMDNLYHQRVSNRFDNVFWVGDFNYRVHIDIPKEYLDEGRYIELLLHDQLVQEIELIGMELNEGMINFPPSYKLEALQNLFYQGGKWRDPAWTDRILYKCSPKASLIQVSYDSCTNIFGSDHRPVYSQFLAKNVFRTEDDIKSSNPFNL